MRIQRNSTKKDTWIMIAGLIVMLSLAVTIVSQKKQNDTLQVYTEPAHVNSVQETVENPVDGTEMQIYTDEAVGFSISIPSSWTKVTGDASVTFVDQKTGSSVEILTDAYDPNQNNVTPETMQQLCAEAGMEFKNFTWKTNSSYEVLYQSFQENTYDYIEDVIWDRGTLVKLICILNDNYYKDMEPYYDYIINSFAWEKPSPIPETCYLTYFDSLNCEIGIPQGWVTSVTGESMYAMDETTGASMTFNTAELTGNLSTWTENDAASMIMQGRDSLIMNYFQTTNTTAYAEASYILNDIRYTCLAYFYSDGIRLYGICFDFEPETISDTLPADCAGLFRSFNEYQETQEQADEAAEASESEFFEYDPQQTATP